MKRIKLKTEFIKEGYQSEQAHLITLGMQFYVAGRICYCRDLIGLFLIIPLLLRHAIEYFIKGHLSYDMGMKEIRKDYGHNLKKLWQKFKEIEKDIELEKYDDFINQFSQTEGIRYPKGHELLKPDAKDAFEIDLAFSFDETTYDFEENEIKWDIATVDGLIYEICRRMRSATPAVEWIEFRYRKCPELFQGNKYFKNNR